MNKDCKQCGQKFEIFDEDLKFYEKVSPVFDGKKFQIPPPKICPVCRQQRRLSFCNEFNLYQGKCDLCGESGLTEHPPHTKQLQYCHECWHSDKWDSCDYGKDLDFSRPFFEQIYELKRSTPTRMLVSDGFNENSTYIHYAGSSKNCYLIMHADFCEDCYYGYGFKKNISCVDGFYNLHSELCYDCVDVYKCYGLKGCQDCVNCNSGAFLRDCIGCNNCFLCVGLRNKKYCFENEEYSKEEYEKKVSEIDLGSYKKYQECGERLKELEKKHSFKYLHLTNVQNCFGDYLKNCKDTWYSFDCEDVEGGRYCYQLVLGSKNVYDIYQYGTNLQESYEACTVGGDNYHLLFVKDGHMASSDLLYCWALESCKNCFGCTNMKRKSYCVFNKQYSKEEYEGLVPRIIEHMKSSGEWGEFFPAEFSIFGYNKTTAQMWYPMEKEEVLERGWKWDDYEPPSPEVKKAILAADLLDNIEDIGDEILESAIECEVTGKLFKLTSHELAFYRGQKVPLPRRWFYQRHLDRFERRNPRKFFKRKCDKCGKEILSTYSPDRSEKICCEECYKGEMY